MARTYKNAKKMRMEGRLHSNDMTEYEKIRWLIDYKNSLVGERVEMPWM